MFKHSKFAVELLTAVALIALLFVPAAAYADEAVSLGGGDIAAGNQVYLGAYDSNPIAWDVEGNSGSLAVHSHYILFTTLIHENADVNAVPELTLETSQLYTSSGLRFKTFPEFKSEAFSDAERSMVGDFALSGDFGGATLPDGREDWYWINEPIYINNDYSFPQWFGYAVNPGDGRGATTVHTEYGVRPASSFDLASVLFSSAAEGGKSGAAGVGEFSALSGTSSVSAWKFTLKDSSRVIRASATGTTAAEGYSAWSVPVTFSGGGTAASDYVSAILCDGEGNALYYGTVANATASGTQDMDVPTGLAAGTYTLKVFSEQRNGNFKTDYAGPFVVIELAVEAAPKPKLTITANDQTYVYNGQLQGPGDIVYEDPAEIAEAVTVEGLEDGDSLASIVLDGQGQDVGTYFLTPSGASIVDSNGKTVTDKYDIAYVDGTLTICREYEITFADEDGTVLQAGKVAEGEIPVYSGEKPTKPATAQYTYAFAGWTPEVVAVTGDATYTATYTEAVREYTVKFVDEDGTVLQAGKVAYGATPEYTGDEPTKAATAQHTYAFAGWNKEIVAVTGDATYTATYKATPVPKPAEKATLTFDLAGGTLDGKTGSITIEANVGDTIKLPAAPKREGYTFKYWKGSQYAAGAGYKVEGDHSFTAVWEKNATSGSGDSDKKSPLPATGDDSAATLTLCALMALASLALLSGSVVLRRRGSAYKGKYSAR